MSANPQAESQVFQASASRLGNCHNPAEKQT